jgi:hypothetical protein
MSVFDGYSPLAPARTVPRRNSADLSDHARVQSSSTNNARAGTRGSGAANSRPEPTHLPKPAKPLDPLGGVGGRRLSDSRRGLPPLPLQALAAADELSAASRSSTPAIISGREEGRASFRPAPAPPRVLPAPARRGASSASPLPTPSDNTSDARAARNRDSRRASLGEGSVNSGSIGSGTARPPGVTRLEGLEDLQSAQSLAGAAATRRGSEGSGLPPVSVVGSGSGSAAGRTRRGSAHAPASSELLSPDPSEFPLLAVGVVVSFFHPLSLTVLIIRSLSCMLVLVRALYTCVYICFALGHRRPWRETPTLSAVTRCLAKVLLLLLLLLLQLLMLLAVLSYRNAANRWVRRAAAAVP